MPAPVRKSLFIPTSGGEPETEIVARLTKAIEENDRLPPHTLTLGEPERQGGKEFKRLDITFENAGPRQTDQLQLREAVELALRTHDLEQYSASSMARSTTQSS